ncbi:unnamed protein product, partial [Prorocentrum cordatum]
WLEARCLRLPCALPSRAASGIDGGGLRRPRRPVDVYQLVPPPAPVKQRPRKYVSQHDPKLPPTASTFVPSGTTAGTVSNVSGDATTKPVADLPGRTFGKPPGASAPDPSNRPQGKTAKVATLSEVKKSNPVLLQPSQLKAKLKPDVPKKVEKGGVEQSQGRYHVISGRRGRRGGRPAYSSYRSPTRQFEALQHSTIVQERWRLNRQYQSMAHLTKLEGPQIRRKARMEAELVQIEKDIEKLSRKNIIIHTDY